MIVSNNANSYSIDCGNPKAETTHSWQFIPILCFGGLVADSHDPICMFTENFAYAILTASLGVDFSA